MSAKNSTIQNDPAEVLFQDATDTTGFTLWRDHQTKQLNFTIDQNGQSVVVSVNNLRVLLDEIVPEFERK